MRRLAFVFLVCGLAGSGCVDQPSERYGAGSQFGANRPARLGTGSFDQRAATQAVTRVAILLPLTGARAELGRVLLQAARLGLIGNASPVLDVLDTGGNAEGAATAATAAVNNGDGLILGPLTSAETASVAQITQTAGIPVLAFSNDSSLAQPGVWTLGISPDEQVDRLLSVALERGKTKFAALLPESDYGRALANALRGALQTRALPDPVVKMHSAGMAAITAATRELADYANRREPLERQIKLLRAQGTTDARREALEVARTPIPAPPFDVLLLADTGDALQEIAAVLPYFDVDRRLVQVLGPALWADPASGSTAMVGAWYAAPDNRLRANFNDRYVAEYGTSAPPLADLAFDAMSIARAVAATERPAIAALTRSDGFVGSDGWISLLPTGQAKRGLAVYQIDRAGAALIEAPPSPGF